MNRFGTTLQSIWEVLLGNIIELLVLQLVTSGVSRKSIARSIGMDMKEFDRQFPWAKKDVK